MKINKYLFLLLLINMVNPFSVKAFNIKKLGLESGLSNNNVISITQDNDGFIWIATKDGLNRFDSNTFEVFKNSESGSNSISSNVLNCVYADKHDDIVWIATEKNGVDAYNYKTKIFTHYEHDHNNRSSLIANGVTDINSDSSGNLWFATYLSGIDYYDKKTGQFTHYNQSNVQGLGSDYNWCILPDNDGKLYVGHVNTGLSIIDLESKTAINLHWEPNNPNCIPNNTVTSLFKDSKGNIWVGSRGGLSLFNPETNSFTNFSHEAHNPNSLSSNNVESIIETQKSELWFGTEGGGINILNLDDLSSNISQATIKFKHLYAGDLPSNISSSSVQTLLQDNFGNIWLGGYIGGVNFISNQESFFNKIDYLPLTSNKNTLLDKVVPDISCDDNNNIWVANSAGGISQYNKVTKIKDYNFILGERYNATAIFYTDRNNIWVGTQDGKIFRFNPLTEKFTRLTLIDEILGIAIYKLFKDSNNHLWVCTDVGLFAIDLNTMKYAHYNTTNSALTDDNIRCITESKNGQLWVGSLGGGLFVFDRNFNLLYNYGKYYDLYSVNQIYVDKRNRIWVGSQNDLFMFQGKQDSVLRIGKDYGLAENTILAITEGHSPNEIWVSTINGISFINLNTKHVSNYSIYDNISKGHYMNGSVVKTDDGTIYFGSQDGITYFNEQPAQISLTVPKVTITQFSVSNTENENLSEFVHIPFDAIMDLKYVNNSFQINFNTLNYALADKVEFMFQMSELDQNWYFLGKEKQVTFRNLKPDNYTFKLKARIHNKDWSNEVTSMYINILPPIWLRWWAKVIYIVLLFCMGYYILIFYKKKLQIENQLIFEKKSHQQELQLNEDKIKFFTNITHELRSPMTLILGPLEDLIIDKSLSPEHVKKINNIHRVANRLLQLINQILEFRKSETQSRKLTVLKEDFAKFFYETGVKYKELNSNKNIDFEVSIPEKEVEMYYDPEVVSIILDNLISNAIKYTPKGKINLTLSQTNDQNLPYAEITIEDTGFGIAKEDLPYIFDRYFQAKNTSYQVSGTGIGLDLVKKMIDLHEAEIEVSSELGEGTCFTLKFLINNSYPEAKHFEIEDIPEETADDDKNVILIVEDNADIAEYIEECLSEDYNIIHAENGKVGFEKSCEAVPDIIVSDVMMPVMDGIEMCKELKKDVRTCHIPVVLLTAKDSLKDKSEGYEAGADSYLTKPFSGTLLRSRIKNIFETRRKLSENNVSKISTTKQPELPSESKATNELDQDFFDKLNSVIYEKLEDEQISIAEIASLMHMSHSTLYRKVKALTNITVNEYIRKIKMNEAVKLLETTQFNISEIMYKVGINSSGYFRQCFKKEFGMNPSEYLQQVKNKSSE